MAKLYLRRGDKVQVKHFKEEMIIYSVRGNNVYIYPKSNPNSRALVPRNWVKKKNG